MLAKHDRLENQITWLLARRARIASANKGMKTRYENQALRLTAESDEKQKRERRKLRALKLQSAGVRREMKAALLVISNARNVKGHEMPPVPGPMVSVARNATVPNRAIPEDTGVYFIWQDGAVEYVGQSANLRQRLCRHPRIVKSDQPVSWIVFDSFDRLRAEAFYLWLLWPPLNGTPERRRPP